MTPEYTLEVVSEMLLRRALRLASTDPERDAVDTLVKILSVPLSPMDEPELGPIDIEAFGVVQNRVKALLDNGLVDGLGEPSTDRYRIDVYPTADPQQRRIDNFAATLEAAQLWARRRSGSSTLGQPVTYVIVDLPTKEDIWHLEAAPTSIPSSIT